MEKMPIKITLKPSEYNLQDDVILLFLDGTKIIVERGIVVGRSKVVTYAETDNQAEIIEGRWIYNIQTPDNRLLVKDSGSIKTHTSKFLKTVEECKGSASYAAHMWDLEEARMRILFPDLQWPNLGPVT